MLRRYDGIDHRSKIVDVGKGFNTKDDVVESALSSGCGLFWGPDDCISIGRLVKRFAQQEWRSR